MNGGRTTLAALTALLLPAIFTGAGCGGDFDPYERLTSLRILAIQSEPVAPAPGEMTTLSALVYVPPPADGAPAPTVTMKWSWCPFVGPANAGYPCLVTEEQVRSVAGDVPPFDLMGNFTAQFKHTLDPAMLRLICNGMAGLPKPPDCSDGFPVTVQLTVSTGDDQETAIRPLHLLLEPAKEPNTNPTISGLVTREADGDEHALQGALLRRLADNNVRAIADESAAETYHDSTGLAVRERLYISWFVETGTMKHPRTGFNPGADPPTLFPDLLPNTWRPAGTDVYKRSTAQLFAVLRDSRDGVMWTNATATLEPKP